MLIKRSIIFHNYVAPTSLRPTFNWNTKHYVTITENHVYSRCVLFLKPNAIPLPDIKYLLFNKYFKMSRLYIMR